MSRTIEINAALIVWAAMSELAQQSPALGAAALELWHAMRTMEDMATGLQPILGLLVDAGILAEADARELGLVR